MKHKELIGRLEAKTAKIGVIGLGYVGLPLVIRFCEEGFRVTGFDVDSEKVELLSRGESYIRHIPSGSIKGYVDSGLFSATTQMSELAGVDAIIICVPTPLTSKREPEMKYVLGTARTVAEHLRPGQVVSLESTTYPGTTEEVLLPELAARGLSVGEDFFLVYSPEREDPGRDDFSTKTTPKVVGGVTDNCLDVGTALYSEVVERVVGVSSTRVAEMTKLLENIYRAVNIAMVNELKMLSDKMGIDIWEVISASATKPFGFTAFKPGPGLGGHCIPIDPFYLTWKARQYDFTTRFIELAGEINTEMPYYVVRKMLDAFNSRGRVVKGSKVLVLGAAYKKDVDDVRESPAIRIIEILKAKGAEVSYNDPYVARLAGMRGHDIDMESVALDDRALEASDCVIIVTDHSCYDYERIVEKSPLVIDTRGATVGIKSDKVVMA